MLIMTVITTTSTPAGGTIPVRTVGLRPTLSTRLVWDGYDDSDSNTGGRYCAQWPMPTPSPRVNISGTVFYCSNSVLSPVPNVTLILTGDAGGSTLSNGSGDYTLSSLIPGGSYTLTPTKAA